VLFLAAMHIFIMSINCNVSEEFDSVIYVDKVGDKTSWIYKF